MPSSSSLSQRRGHRRSTAGLQRRLDRTPSRQRARNAPSQLRIKRTTYDYAGQDPINEYDLSGDCSGFWGCVSAVGSAIGHPVRSVDRAGHTLGRALGTIRPEHPRDFLIGVWEGTDTLIIGSLTYGTAGLCGAALVPSGGLVLIGCIPALGAEGLGTYLSGKATARDFENAYRHRRKHR
jgi:hypothetical protein